MGTGLGRRSDKNSKTRIICHFQSQVILAVENYLELPRKTFKASDRISVSDTFEEFIKYSPQSSSWGIQETLPRRHN